MTSFIYPGTTTKISFKGVELELSNSFGNGIGIYMVIDKPIPDQISDDKVGDEYLIHGIGNIGYGFQGFMDGLTHEFWYYEHFKYDVKNYEQIVDFYEYDVDVTEANEILKTPVDWTGLDKPQEEEEENKEEEEKIYSNNEELVDILINKGEGPIVEFKSSLVAYKNAKEEVGYSRHIKFKITKTIASFLNSKGGFLLIGVNDNKSIVGLENGFSLAGNKIKNPKDYFNLELDKIIKEHFRSVASNINADFVEKGGKLIYILKVDSSTRPIFIFNNTDRDKNNHRKEFYVRTTGASSIQYNDIEDIVGYCMNHWPNKEK